MLTDRLDDWKTQAEAAEILKCSQKTVGRMAAQRRFSAYCVAFPDASPCRFSIQTISRRSVLRRRNPKHSRLKSGVRKRPLARVPRQSGVDLLAQLLADRISPAGAVPVEQKVFLNLKEAAEYSGLSKAWLLREIKNGKIKAIKTGGWRIRRSDLLQL